MASYTNKYHLKKPSPEDRVQIEDLNENFDAIDEVLGDKADLEDGKVRRDQLPLLDYVPNTAKGQPNGVASLDSTGKVPADQVTVNADPAGTAQTKVSDHNVSPAAHADIRSIANNAKASAEAALQAVAQFAYTINIPPTQSGVLIYNGSNQSPSWANFDTEQLTISGTQSAKNAGSYTATFTPKGEYHWPDGTQNPMNITWAIKSQPITSLPAQSGTLTYDGNSKTPSWNSAYDSNKMTLSVTGQINAGTYSASFTPKTNYCWDDESVTAKSVNWTIGKAAGSLSLNKTALTIVGVVNTTATFTATRAGDGVISVSSSNANVATASVDSSTGIVTVALKGNGSATITVSVAAGTNHNAPANQTCSVTGSMIDGTFANNSWATIAAASEGGNIPSTWKVGDEKDITISGETVTLVIMDFKHDDLQSGGKAGITLGMKNLLATKRQMNSSNTNQGGFTGSAMYTWLQNDFYNGLPADLKSAIKMVNKKTSAGQQSATINTNAMKIFLFSEIEVFGSTSYSKADEGTQYSYFATAANRTKYLSNGTGSANDWWERSPNGSYSTCFCCVNSNGSANSISASFSIGVCAGFCI